MLVFKGLINYLFFLMHMVIILLMKIHTENNYVNKINNYNIEIDGTSFYDQPINDLVKQYDESRKKSTGQGDD